MQVHWSGLAIANDSYVNRWDVTARIVSTISHVLKQWFTFGQLVNEKQ